MAKGRRAASLAVVVAVSAVALTLAAIPAAEAYKVPKPCKVPNVVGKKLSSAEQKVTKAGCSVGSITSTTSSTVKKGRVISTNPAAGSTGAHGAPVNLTVSLGKPKPGAKCKVPRLKGHDLTRAGSQLVHANCGVGTVTSRSSQKIAKGHVISSNPAAGATRPVGTKVGLVVSSGKHKKKKH